MPRPPSDRVEEGFAIWSTDAERNDTRTAELMGVPQTTVSYWRRTYRWDERYFSFVQPDAEFMVEAGVAAMRATVPAVTQRMVHIATAKKPVYDADGKVIGEGYASQDRDAIQATKLIYQYALSDVPLDGWPRAIEAQVQVPPWEGQPIEEMSPAERSAAACRVIEAHLRASDPRPNRRRKRG
jgi:hypothetical protein